MTHTPTHEEAQASSVRSGAGLFRHANRGLIAIDGSDRVRWLDAMLSNDIAGLVSGPEHSGCYAALLTRQGRIVADLHVLLREDALLLELGGAAVAQVIAQLEKLVIADDVAIADVGATTDRLGLEGPAARDVLAAASGEDLALAPDAWREIRVAGTQVVAARYGWSGEDAYQLFAPAGSGSAVAQSIEAAGGERGLVAADPEVLEILRIEAGIPALGSELDETVLPAEARLDRAVSETKGCYVGQEVVARMRSRGRASQLLVGLSLSGDPLPEPGDAIFADGARVGELTSRCHSPIAGAIALAFVRRAHAQPGAELVAGSCRARVTSLPFVAAAAFPGAPGS